MFVGWFLWTFWAQPAVAGVPAIPVAIRLCNGVLKPNFMSTHAETGLAHLVDPRTNPSVDQFESALLAGSRWTPVFALIVIERFAERVVQDRSGPRPADNHGVWEAVIAVEARWTGRLHGSRTEFEMDKRVLSALQRIASCLQQPKDGDAYEQKYYEWGLQIVEKFARLVAGG
jgi:hypothetical protein